MVNYKKETVAVESEEWFYLSLHEVISSFGISKETIIEIIDEGIIDVQKDEHDEWQFDRDALHRIRTVLQLNRDLGINFAGGGLVLELLSEIERLHLLLGNQRD